MGADSPNPVAAFFGEGSERLLVVEEGDPASSFSIPRSLEICIAITCILV
jgi:hypothetical protein